MQKLVKKQQRITITSPSKHNANLFWTYVMWPNSRNGTKCNAHISMFAVYTTLKCGVMYKQYWLHSESNMRSIRYNPIC